MKQYTFKEFEGLLIHNGYLLDRSKGSHFIFVKEYSSSISVPKILNSCIARRLIKENNLKI